jgi:hypothetical protein
MSKILLIARSLCRLEREHSTFIYLFSEENKVEQGHEITKKKSHLTDSLVVYLEGTNYLQINEDESSSRYEMYIMICKSISDYIQVTAMAFKP